MWDTDAHKNEIPYNKTGKGEGEKKKTIKKEKKKNLGCNK